MKQEQKSIDPIERLIALAKNQEEFINLSTELLKGKNRMIELCEMEISWLKKENKDLRTAMLLSFICSIVMIIVNFIILFR